MDDIEMRDDELGMINDEKLQESHDVKTCLSHQCLERLYDFALTDTFCDAMIQLSDRSFVVHRAVMSSSSEYFRALFSQSQNNIKDGKMEVFIPGIGGDVMALIISYVYKRKCDITDENVFELMTIADYVGMVGLIKQCIKHLVGMLNPGNCVGIMLFGRFRLCDELYSKARNYIMVNFMEISTKSEEIVNLSLKDIYDILSDDLLNCRDEEHVFNVVVRWIDHDPVNRRPAMGKLLRAVRLGLLNTRVFMENVKDHPYIAGCDEAKPLIFETFKFIYELGDTARNQQEFRTPAIAIPRIPHEIIFAIGGWSEGRSQSCLEAYDTRADRWVRIPIEDPAGPRAYHGTAVIGTKIYCIGGFDGSEYFNTCRVFDVVKKTWKEIAPMHSKRCYVSVTELNGHIYALGGYDGTIRQNTGERYDPKTNQWTMIKPMNMQRSDGSACTLNNKIYITGGFNGTECMNSAEFFDPETESWTILPNMISRRSGVSCVAYRDKIYAVGGFNGLSRIATAECFNPETDEWSSIREMYHPRSNFGLEVIDNFIIAAAGFNGVETISQIECYDLDNDEWLEGTNMSMVRSGLSVCVVKGLPNIQDFIHQDRTTLLEESRRIRMENSLAIELREAELHAQEYSQENVDISVPTTARTDSSMSFTALENISPPNTDRSSSSRSRNRQV